MCRTEKSAVCPPARIGVAAGLCGVILLLATADVAGAARGNAGTRGSGSGGRSGGRMAETSISSANRTSGVATGNRTNVAAGNTVSADKTVNAGNKINTGNVNAGNVNIGNDVNIDIDGGGHWNGHGHGHVHHPVAAGVAVGAVAVTTAAVVGARYYALPPTGCTTVVRNGVAYHHCGSVYYQQVWSGNDVVYVVASF